MSLMRAAGALALLGGVLAGCAAASGPSAGPTASAAQAQGRSQCAGSAPVALTNLEGAAADTVERLQGTYEGRPGFLAVIFDGTKAIVVVEAASLPAWLADLTPKGVSVASGCVDPALLAAVKAVAPALTPPDGISSAGYNGLDDYIDVLGVSPDALLAALDKEDPAVGARARNALTSGTLRINGNKVSATR